MGKVGKGEESVGGSGTGGSFKELTGRKGARKGRGRVGGKGACGERSSVVCLHTTLYTLHFKLHTLHSTQYTLHCTLDTRHATLHTLHFTLYIPLPPPGISTHLPPSPCGLLCFPAATEKSLTPNGAPQATPFLPSNLATHLPPRAIGDLQHVGSFASQQPPNRASPQRARPSHALVPPTFSPSYTPPRNSNPSPLFYPSIPSPSNFTLPGLQQPFQPYAPPATHLPSLTARHNLLPCLPGTSHHNQL